MLVQVENFEECFSQLEAEVRAEKFAAVDTETTALFWWNSPHYAIRPRVFSLQFSTAENDYYFDFGCEESLKTPEKVLGGSAWERFQELFCLGSVTWFIHNAKFDMHHLANHGVYIDGTVHCTQAIQRVVNNLEGSGFQKGAFKLGTLGEKYLGVGKVDLSEYWTEERITKIKRPGENGKFYDFYHYDRLPLDILVKYGETDTRLCYRLGKWQLEQIQAKNEAVFGSVPSNYGGSLLRVLDNERELTKTLFHVERRGIQLDIPFVKQAHDHAINGIKTVLAEIDQVAAPFVAKWNEDKKEKEQLPTMDWNSGPMLKGLFDSLEIPYAYTQKGTASFDKDALEKSKHPLAAKILEYRRHSKRAHTYLENYLWLSDEDGVLHCSFEQGGTETGRLSCRDPNMQNVPKRADKKEADFVLRRCFIPRPGKVLVSCDYDQAEYRLMLDYAREAVLIDRILSEGLNVHEATQAELNFDDYDDAKTMNFKILYGSGLAAISYDLFKPNCSLEELQALCKLKVYKMNRYDGYDKDRALYAAIEARGQVVELMEILNQGKAKMELYFRKLPKVQEFTKNVRKKAKDQGLIHTWLGRILRYDVKNQWGRIDDYKAPNGLCQGGVGDLGKKSLNEGHALLSSKTKGSYVVLHVHDELLAEVDKTETAIVPELVKTLSECYPHRLIPITAGAAWSEKSWGDLKDGLP